MKRNNSALQHGNDETYFRDVVTSLMQTDALRMQCLRAVRELALPQGYIGAGFLRNAIWDYLHAKNASTELNDVDVIYFSPSSAKSEDAKLETVLANAVPSVNWEVKNQAHMHKKHGHAPYENCEQAISNWVEQETCVAVRLTNKDGIEVLAPFGLSANFASTISLSPKFKRKEVLMQRVKQKAWLTQWPNLQLKA